MQSASLVGREEVDGIPAWHVEVRTTNGWRFEFWLDVAHPAHVIRQEDPNLSGWLTAKFDPSHPADPLPVEIHQVDHYGGKPEPWNTWMTRLQSRINVPIDSKAFTLAGLEMPMGTWVADRRLRRSIGYWNGTVLSSEFPRNVPPSESSPAGRVEYTPESLPKAMKDRSFVDQQKILVYDFGKGFLVMVGLGMVIIFIWRRNIFCGQTDRQ
jgi:hypothetical protein